MPQGECPKATSRSIAMVNIEGLLCMEHIKENFQFFYKQTIKLYQSFKNIQLMYYNLLV